MPIKEKKDYGIFKQRRSALLQELIKKYGQQAEDGVVIIFGAFEQDGQLFRQERSFYYLTGIEEPASAVVLDGGKSILFVPNFGQERAKWVTNTIAPGSETSYGLDEIAFLGQQCKGYQCPPFFSINEYSTLLAYINSVVEKKKTIFTCNPENSSGYVEQRFLVQRLIQMIPNLGTHIKDLSGVIAMLRRKKSNYEIELLYKAIGITAEAQDVVSKFLQPDKIEYEVQAIIEYIFTSSGGGAAFPSIVAAGKNSTVLHYTDNNKKIESGDLVVVDIGAEYDYYCADITRTYPASGTFTQRQREIYSLVLETQDFIAQTARPGLWLSNKERPEESLNHLARKFLQDRGYDTYFTHGIGHFLGLDVHDVGDYNEPLAVGDVITIEPGIYIPQENIGIRIEDDYWIVPDGTICLSEDLPKTADEIEAMMVKEDESSQADD